MQGNKHIFRFPQNFNTTASTQTHTHTYISTNINTIASLKTCLGRRGLQNDEILFCANDFIHQIYNERDLHGHLIRTLDWKHCRRALWQNSNRIDKSEYHCRPSTCQIQVSPTRFAAVARSCTLHTFTPKSRVKRLVSPRRFTPTFRISLFRNTLCSSFPALWRAVIAPSLLECKLNLHVRAQGCIIMLSDDSTSVETCGRSTEQVFRHCTGFPVPGLSVNQTVFKVLVHWYNCTTFPITRNMICDIGNLKPFSIQS